MRYLVDFPLTDGGVVTVEVDEIRDNSAGYEPAARSNNIHVRASQTLENALETVRPTISSVINMIGRIDGADSPNEIEVEFGLKLSAEAGAFIAAASVEANYRVILKWKRSEKTT